MRFFSGFLEATPLKPALWQTEIFEFSSISQLSPFLFILFSFILPLFFSLSSLLSYSLFFLLLPFPPSFLCFSPTPPLLPICSQPSFMNLRTSRWGWYIISPSGTPDLPRLTHFSARQFLAWSAIVLSHTVVWHHQHFCVVFIYIPFPYTFSFKIS